MAIRKQTLEEWFLAYQLECIKKKYFHLPMPMEVDVTELVMAFERARESIPYTAVLIKAAAMAAKKFSPFNRVLLPRAWGARIIEFQEVRVALPMTVNVEGDSHQAATVIANADAMSLEEIRSHIKAAKQQDVGKMLVGRYVVGRSNCFLNRLRLRLIHFCFYHFASLYQRYGGSVGVSSLMSFNEEGFWLTPHSYGPTALTVCSSSLQKRPGLDGARWIWRLGLGLEHKTLTGVEMIHGLQIFKDCLCRIRPDSSSHLSSHEHRSMPQRPVPFPR